jgi:hypothetical protein
VDEALERILEQLEKDLPGIVLEEASKVENPRISGIYVYAKNYDYLKYHLAKKLAQALIQIPCIREVYYADIASGEYITGQTYFGRDVDLIIIADQQNCPQLKEYLTILEQKINQIVARTATKLPELGWLKTLAETNGIVEFHLDDVYTKMLQDKKTQHRISDLNVIQLANK